MLRLFEMRLLLTIVSHLAAVLHFYPQQAGASG